MNCTQLTEATLPEEISTIGCYAFYNTGITSVEIPATVTSLGDYAFAACMLLDNVTIPANVNTFGDFCFAYCASLSNFAFASSNTVKTMGTHFFYYCPNITQVILPNQFKITQEEAIACGQNGYNLQGVIPSYTFAGTGIVVAKIPATVTYYYTFGVLENCKSLEQIVLMGSPAQSSTMYQMGADWISGCDKFEMLYLSVLNNQFVYPPEWAENSGMTEIHIGAIDVEAVPTFHQSSRFSYISEGFSLYFDEHSYEELIKFFSGVSNSWKLKVFDKDGNQLICSEKNGTVARVLDADGNVIWEATAE